MKEEDDLRSSNIYFKEESATKKRRSSTSSQDGNGFHQQTQTAIYGSGLPTTSFPHTVPIVPVSLKTETKPIPQKKKLDQDRTTDRYIATLEEFIEQQNKALMQKDHLINIKDQTIEQLQRHIESLTAHCAHWVSREIKPYAVQYTMTLPTQQQQESVTNNPPTTPITIPSQLPVTQPTISSTPIHVSVSQNPASNVRYVNFPVQETNETAVQTMNSIKEEQHIIQPHTDKLEIQIIPTTITPQNKPSPSQQPPEPLNQTE